VRAGKCVRGCLTEQKIDKLVALKSINKLHKTISDRQKRHKKHTIKKAHAIGGLVS